MDAKRTLVFDEGLQSHEVRESEHLCGDRPGQLVAFQEQTSKRLGVAKLSGNGACELVSSEGQGGNHLHLRQREGDGAGQLVQTHSPEKKQTQ